jgi:hypothetical protein
MAPHARFLTAILLMSAVACTATGRHPMRTPSTNDAVMPGQWEQVYALPFGEPLVVTTNTGQRLEGAFNALDSTTLTLSVASGGAPVIVQRSEIARIAAPATSDGLANGTLIGAGAGLGVALAILGALASQDGYVLPSAKTGAPLLLAGVGGLVGMWIDRAHKRLERVLYLAAPRGSSANGPG